MERDPSGWLALALAEVDEQLVVMGVLEWPATVGIALRLDDADRLGNPLVRRYTGIPQVVERA